MFVHAAGAGLAEDARRSSSLTSSPSTTFSELPNADTSGCSGCRDEEEPAAARVRFTVAAGRLPEMDEPVTTDDGSTPATALLNAPPGFPPLPWSCAAATPPLREVAQGAGEEWYGREVAWSEPLAGGATRV